LKQKNSKKIADGNFGNREFFSARIMIFLKHLIAKTESQKTVTAALLAHAE